MSLIFYLKTQTRQKFQYFCRQPTFKCYRCPSLSGIVTTYETYLSFLSTDVHDLHPVEGCRCTGPTFSCVHRCVPQTLNFEVILGKEFTIQSQKHTQHIIIQISIPILCILIDSDTCLSTSNWKTEKAKWSFVFTESLSPNASYSQGGTVKDLL
jgi:hypothetical protein